MHTLKRSWIHIVEQPFIAATGLAALVHSTWSLGTLFSGVQPQPPAAATAQAIAGFVLQTLAWHIPAFLIAFALDIGQIVTSDHIRAAVQHGATWRDLWRKYVTFAVFAVATYYLQWLYCAHHIPQLMLGDGVSDVHRGTAQSLLDLAVWIVPLFLPLSTLMYTFSHNAHRAPAVQDALDEADGEAQATIVVRRPVPLQQALPMPEAQSQRDAKAHVQQMDGRYVVTCPHCGTQSTHDTEVSASRAWSAHTGRWCKVLHPRASADVRSGGAS
jgi:hypothetical protein